MELEDSYVKTQESFNTINTSCLLIKNKAIEGIREIKTPLYRILRRIDSEINRGTLLLSNKTSKQNALRELKERIINYYNRNEPIEFKDVVGTWKRDYKAIIQTQRGIFTKKKTKTEQFFDELESNFSKFKL